MNLSKLSFYFTCAILLSLGCFNEKTQQLDNSEKFTSELAQLKAFFKIPGLAASIEQDGQIIYKNYFGFSDFEKKIKVDSSTLFPIASLTKVFSGILIMKLVEQGKISINDPIKKHLPEVPLNDSILIKHILSHTSQGSALGEKFYYSSRFSILTEVIEEVSNSSFSEFLEKEILHPLKLKNTFLLKDSIQLNLGNYNLAQPYNLDNGITKGHLDFGYSASAGIVSNLEDLEHFNFELDNNNLISKISKEIMFSSANINVPYGHGIFIQNFNDEKIIWAYGQYDSYSSLYLKIPSKKLTLTLLANNNLMSDPARLIYGDVTSSLFAISFLKNYAFELGRMNLLETADVIDFKVHRNNIFYRKKLLSQALAESFMARFEIQKFHTSIALLEKVFSEYPEYLEYADLNLLHNLIFLKDIAFHMELGEFNKFDNQIKKIGSKLLQEDSENPYLHSYLGSYYDRKENALKAKHHFEKILSVKNFSKNWYTVEADNWIKKYGKE